MLIITLSFPYLCSTEYNGGRVIIRSVTTIQSVPELLLHNCVHYSPLFAWLVLICTVTYTQALRNKEHTSRGKLHDKNDIR